MTNEQIVAAIRHAQQIAGKPIYRIVMAGVIVGCSPLRYRIIAEIVKGYNTVTIWTEIMEILLDEEGAVLSPTPLISHSIDHSCYSGKGIGD